MLSRMRARWFARFALSAAALAFAEEDEDSAELESGAFSKVSSVLNKLSNFLGEQEDSQLDDFGELSLAYPRPTDGKVHAMRLKLKDLAVASPMQLFSTGSAGKSLTAEEDAAESEALDEAIAMATEGIHFIGEQGPSAATVIRAKVTGAPDFRRAVAQKCSAPDSVESCRRAAGEDLLCMLAKHAAPDMLRPGDAEAAAAGQLCNLSTEVGNQALMLMAGKAKTSVRSAEEAEEAEAAESVEESDDQMTSEAGEDLKDQEASKPWEHVEQIAGSMLQALRENGWPQQSSGSVHF